MLGRRKPPQLVLRRFLSSMRTLDPHELRRRATDVDRVARVQDDQRVVTVELRLERAQTRRHEDAGRRVVASAVVHFHDGDDLSELVEVDVDLHGTHTRMWYSHVSVPSLRIVTKYV